MGKRVEGRKKQKSVKANVTSKFSSKRKLSRMGKKVKAGKMGPNTEFITRSAALRKLQITLKDFRRLCILKGVYPRVPAKGLQGNDKVYYDIKDISYIMHEPLLHKFREFKGFMKKIRRAAGRNQFEEARRKNDLKPKFTLDHLVKERYPRFIDALRDLDDALCMIHLFAALPSSGRITTEHTLKCQQLAREWQYYVAKSRSLRKVFVSVKGVYFQAEVLGESITWLVPHAFTQSLPREVDFRVMITFLDFYEVFVRFALFKLFHMKAWNYPPEVNHDLEAEGCCLLALKADEIMASNSNEGGKTATSTDNAKRAKKTKEAAKIKAIDVTALLNKNNKNSNNDSDDDDDEEEEEEEEEADLTIPLQNAFSDLQSFQPNHNTNDASSATAATGEEERVFKNNSSDGENGSGSLFERLVFFVNREVPLDWCQLCITAFGGKIGWDSPSSPIKSSDPRITHHIIDRPMQATHNTAASSAQREYVQPQWIFDSINARLLLPTRLYAAGGTLPPHLSPFVNDEKEGYVPQYRETLNNLQKQQLKGSGNQGGEGDEEEDEEAEKEAEAEEFEEVDDFQQQGAKKNKSKKDKKEESDDSEDESEEEEEEEELEEELEEVPASKYKVADSNNNSKKGPKAIVYQKKEEKVNEEEETRNLSMQMMKKKTKRLYDRMQHGIEKKQQQVQSLLTKRKAALQEETPPATDKKQQKKAKK